MSCGGSGGSGSGGGGGDGGAGGGGAGGGALHNRLFVTGGAAACLCFWGRKMAEWSILATLLPPNNENTLRG